jgi:hypothetical protein
MRRGKRSAIFGSAPKSRPKRASRWRLKRSASGHSLSPRGAPDDLIEDPEQQAWLAKARVMSANGATLQQIADALNAAGVRTARGRSTWYPATVKSILGNSRAAMETA